jgi:hypothetical protein
MAWWWRRRKRERIRRGAFPEPWKAILRRVVPFYRRLPAEDRAELEGHILVLLDEKNFEGAGGLELTDEIRLTIAAHAALLLLHRETDYYPGLYSIIVYPEAYVVRQARREPTGTVREGDETRYGESTTRGAVVLAWDAVRGTATDPSVCHNVALHEFAHQLDAEDGSVEGTPRLPASLVGTWARVLGQDFDRLRRDTAAGKGTLLSAYGATNPAEFFAVASECFFSRPRTMQRQYPDLYHQLAEYYRQDPSRW